MSRGHDTSQREEKRSKRSTYEMACWGLHADQAHGEAGGLPDRALAADTEPRTRARALVNKGRRPVTFDWIKLQIGKSARGERDRFQLYGWHHRRKSYIGEIERYQLFGCNYQRTKTGVEIERYEPYAGLQIRCWPLHLHAWITLAKWLPWNSSIAKKLAKCWQNFGRGQPQPSKIRATLRFEPR
jgi:hypothetical protein